MAFAFDLYVRGAIPKALEGSLVIACSRRNKDRSIFARWHDSQADLFRLDLRPGRPGRIRAHLLSPDPTGSDLGLPKSISQRHLYATQPNHGINIRNNSVWATNLLFGAPLEIDLGKWKSRRILRYLEPTQEAPQLSSTAHFAWSLDARFAYFHQSRLENETAEHDPRSAKLILVELDTKTSGERKWDVIPPKDDSLMETANFHSAFYFEEEDRRYVGLLRTGARLEGLAPHLTAADHLVRPMPFSTIWILELHDDESPLQAYTLPGLEDVRGLALSHLDIEARGGNGFVLYANYKQADVAEETHGENIYGEAPIEVREQYAGMTVEAINYGTVIRYEQRNGKHSLRTFSRPYDPENASQGHSWLPINIELDPANRRLFCTFSGFRPRLLPRHITDAYPGLTVDHRRIRYVPPLLLRFRADTLEVDVDKYRRHLSYAEPIAMTIGGDGMQTYICTFSPEIGLRIYPAEDLSAMVCHAVAPELMTSGETHFRPDPAHMKFVPH
jgi:hypothetical protein